MWQSIEMKIAFKAPENTNDFIRIIRAHGHHKLTTLGVSPHNPDMKILTLTYKTGNDDIVHCACEALWGRIADDHREIRVVFDFRGQTNKILDTYKERLARYSIDANVGKYSTLDIKRNLNNTNADIILGFIDYCKQVMITN